jgi:tripartite-type tricarboxylate transporter receptor subunit TctC
MKFSARFRWLMRALLLLPTVVCAQAPFPNKPIRMVVPFPAGGTVDFFARVISPKLSEALGQQVVVDNRSGAGGNIATEFVARSPADGYTLLMGSEIVSINISLYAKLNYDPMKDLEPVSLVGTVPNILIASPSFQAGSLKDLIATAKAKPGQLSYASTGFGTSSQLSSELLKSMAGVHIIHIPYKGGAPAIADLMGGQVELMFVNMPTGLAHVKAGKVKVLGVSSAKRVPQIPDVPTIEEGGLKGFETYAWSGVYAPAGTPTAIISRLNNELNRILKMPDVREQLAAQGAEAGGNTPEQFKKFTADEISKWARVIKASGARIE